MAMTRHGAILGGFCRFVLQSPQIQGVQTMTATELTSTVRELKELKLMAADIAADIENLEDRIKAEMTKRNTDELTVDVFKVRWQTITSKRFDATAFKATHGALYSQYSKPTTTRRFSVA